MKLESRLRLLSKNGTWGILALQWIFIFIALFYWVVREDSRNLATLYIVDWVLQICFAMSLVVGRVDQIVLTYINGSKGGSTLWRALNRLLTHYSWVLTGYFITFKRDFVLVVTRGMIVIVSIALVLAYLRHGKKERLSCALVLIFMIMSFLVLNYVQGGYGEIVVEKILYWSWITLIFLGVINLGKQLLVTIKEGSKNLSVLEPILTINGCLTSYFHIYYLWTIEESVWIVRPAFVYISLLLAISLLWSRQVYLQKK